VKSLSKLFFQHTGRQPESVALLPGSGSDRRYYRLSVDDCSVVGVVGTSFEENRAFVALSRHLKAQRLPVPELISVSPDGMCYLQEDLGDVSLFDLIRQADSVRDDSMLRGVLERTLSLLPDVQFRGAQGWDFSRCFPQPAFDRRTVLWDLNYFKYCFLKPLGVSFREDLLEDDFETFSRLLLQHDTNTFLYRDFQSRNVMIRQGEPVFIDYQGGRRGPVYYDVASFLWQAKAGFSDDLRDELLDVYLRSLRRYQPDVDGDAFRTTLRYFVLFRTLQVLGAYGFRGYVERKQHFVDSVPFAVRNLRRLTDDDFAEFPYLMSVLRTLAGSFFRREETATETATKMIAETSGCRRLTVAVYSFAYKNGIPQDDSGNGGGYVFDCRAICNPGRYDVYKDLTGLDRPVIEFLEAGGEMGDFLKPVYALADRHVVRYMERGFARLMFCFGCTGGQHRSVYAAQRLAEYLSAKYPVDVVLEHREQHLKIVF
jgi:aminoglycoside/choline kinase family phosphotransferase